MSGYYNDPDNYDSSEERDSGGGGLRKQLEETLAELRDLKRTQKQETVTELLRGKGLDPAVAAIIPETADPRAWVEENAHLFGIKPPERLEDAPVAEPEVRIAEDNDPAVIAERQALEAQSDAAESGLTAALATDLESRLDKFEGSAEDLERFFATNGGLGG